MGYNQLFKFFKSQKRKKTQGQAKKLKEPFLKVPFMTDVYLLLLSGRGICKLFLTVTKAFMPITYTF